KMRLRTALLPLVLLIMASCILVRLAIALGSSTSRDRLEGSSAGTSSSVLVGAAADPIFGAAPESIPVPVVAATVQQRDAPIYFFDIGFVQTFKAVTVSSLVDGKPLSASFEE